MCRRKLLNLLTIILVLTSIHAQNHVLSLDGDGDYVSLPNVIIEENTFTIEGWAYLNGSGGGALGQQAIFSQRDYETGTGKAGILLVAENITLTNNIRFNIRSTQGPNDILEFPAGVYGEWHHYAGVVGLDSVYLFFDGVQVDAVENHQLGSFGLEIDLIEIGRHHYEPNYTQGYFNGFMDDIRIWGGALSDVDIVDVRNGQIQFIQFPILANWDFESDDLFDISQNGHDGTPMGDAHVVEMEQNNIDLGYSLYMDGNNDYASFPDPIIHSTEFTIEIWAAMLGTGGGLDQQNTLFSQRDYNTQANRSAILLTAENYPAGSLTSFNIRSNEGISDVISNTAPEYGDWHHYAGVLSADSLYLYMDGELVSTGVNNQTGVFDYSIDHMDLGRHYHSINWHAGYFYGYMDDLKVWSVARTAEQIQTDMHTQILETDSTLIGYYNFDSEFVEDLSGYGNHGALWNGASIEIANLNPGACPMNGDVNGSGNIDISDVLTLVHQIIGIPVNSFNENCADLSGEGVINISDVIMLVDLIIQT